MHKRKKDSSRRLEENLAKKELVLALPRRRVNEKPTSSKEIDRDRPISDAPPVTTYHRQQPWSRSARLYTAVSRPTDVATVYQVHVRYG
ncbi:hypothetical protein EVAR_18575_1 [Eumeta japonica]|uniref:Uncharacterized protein n=1 Tax=Eumeta variegata TaxID=151549 RepID=A0A4C1V410_EUMVA|nr:hypothetical protein EVAR_18575_1 [Eumeta japonica]